MTTGDRGAPSLRRRASAVVSLLATAVVVVAVVVFLAHNLGWLVVALVGVAIAAAGVWWVLTERLLRQGVGIAGLVIGAAAVVVAMVQAVEGTQNLLLRLAAVAAALAVAALAGRAAMALDLRELDGLRDVKHVHPRKPVLLCNPWSGGGKVEKFGLVEMAEEMGVEVVLLDAASTSRSWPATRSPAAPTASGWPAATARRHSSPRSPNEHDIPFVCISAGTRNHFALDLGFDREDPRKGMVAFRDGVERFIDYATVGDRLFVNNVSLGIYATIVQEDDYRDAKNETTRSCSRRCSASRRSRSICSSPRPTAARSTAPSSSMVSNNPYVLGPSFDISQRRTHGHRPARRLRRSPHRPGRGGRGCGPRATLGLASRDPHLARVHRRDVRGPLAQRQGLRRRRRRGTGARTPLEFRIHACGLRMLVPRGRAGRRGTPACPRLQPKGLLEVAMGRRPAAPAGGAAGGREVTPP